MKDTTFTAISIIVIITALVLMTYCTLALGVELRSTN
jgi:hypothetical protein